MSPRYTLYHGFLLVDEYSINPQYQHTILSNKPLGSEPIRPGAGRAITVNSTGEDQATAGEGGENVAKGGEVLR